MAAPTQRYFAGLSRNTFLLALSSLFADISTEMLYPVLPIFLTQVLHASGSIVGLVDESDMLAALLTDAEGANRTFARLAKDVMVTRLETVSADAPIADLVPLFRHDHVAIVMDGERFLGLATRLDLINYFRIMQR